MGHLSFTAGACANVHAKARQMAIGIVSTRGAVKKYTQSRIVNAKKFAKSAATKGRVFSGSAPAIVDLGSSV